MDPRSDVRSLLKLRSDASGSFAVAGGDCSFQFGAHPGPKRYAVARGECGLAVDGVAEPVRTRAGECLVLPRGRLAQADGPRLAVAAPPRIHLSAAERPGDSNTAAHSDPTP